LHCAAVHADIQTINLLSSSGLYGLNAEALDTSGKPPMTCLLERQYVPASIMEAFENLIRDVSIGRRFVKQQGGEQVSLRYTSATAPRIQIETTNTPKISNHNSRTTDRLVSLRRGFMVCVWKFVVVSIAFTLLNLERKYNDQISRPKIKNTQRKSRFSLLG
jgi:hypothetical protein